LHVREDVPRLHRGRFEGQPRHDHEDRFVREPVAGEHGDQADRLKSEPHLVVDHVHPLEGGLAEHVEDRSLDQVADRIVERWIVAPCGDQRLDLLDTRQRGIDVLDLGHSCLQSYWRVTNE